MKPNFVRFGHGRLVNSNEVRKRLNERQEELGFEEIIPFSSEPALLLNFRQSFVKESFTRPHFGAGTVIESLGDFVEGVMLRTTYEGAVVLDRAEGVHEGHYILKQSTVKLSDGTQQAIPIYIAHPNKVLPESHPAYGKPHPEYLLAILTGGKEQGFSTAYLKKIASVVEQAEYIRYVESIANQYGDTKLKDYLDHLIDYSRGII